MHPSLKKVGAGISGVFEVLNVNDSHFYSYWHYHPQYEIMLIQKSSGAQYIGDSIGRFSEGDVIFLGPNIPHIFKNQSEYFNPNSKKKAKATVLYISNDFFDSDFFDLTEMQSIKKLLTLSKRGIKIYGPSKKTIANMLVKCVRSDNEDRIINFLSLMNYIAKNSEYEVLASNSFLENTEDKDMDRLNKVFDFLLNNFHNDINLSEVSEVASMSSTAFCRFFKKHTNKTMVTFLNEIRIGHACKLLIENENMNISDICFESGFNNLTNFIIQFKKIKDCPPSHYRQKYHQQKINF
jgi:AraC-like DNA-binding protein